MISECGKNIEKPRILVCQVGARHRYATPRMFESAGMLAGLYTDSSAQSTIGKIGSCCHIESFERLKRLVNRKIIGVPKEKIYSTDYPLIRSVFESFFFRKSYSDVRLQKRYGDWLSYKAIKRGIDGIDIVYSMNCSNLDFVEFSKMHGCKSIIDVFISPKTDKIILEEGKKFPEFATSAPSITELRFMKALWSRAFDLADILLCPSEWVSEGIVELYPKAEDKLRIVPYGCTIDYEGRKNDPKIGRVLFAGGDVIRKGLCYLAKAATLLKSEIPNIDIRIAGQFSKSVMESNLCVDLNFLGKLTKEEMMKEYLSSDVFILPSLSEGFAGVVAEAVTAGCPVVVTKESGSPVVDSREGFVIEAQSSDDIIKSLKKIILNRELRNEMSNKCIEQANFYSENNWKNRLVSAII